MKTLGIRVTEDMYKKIKREIGPAQLSDVFRGLLNGLIEGDIELSWEDDEFKVKNMNPVAIELQKLNRQASPQEFVEIWQSRNSIKEVAEALEISWSAVYRRANSYRKDGFILKPFTRGRKIDPDELKRFIEAWQSAKSPEEAAKILGLSHGTARAKASNYRERNGIGLKKFKKGPKTIQDREPSDQSNPPNWPEYCPHCGEEFQALNIGEEGKAECLECGGKASAGDAFG